MALTNYYVDPQNGSDSTGTGAIGSPWQTTQHALNTIVAGAGGDQINIKATTDDVLAAGLDFTTYGSPTAIKPVVFRGYTSAANDGGIGGLSGNASVTIYAGGKSYVSFINLHCHNVGAHNVIGQLSADCFIVSCEGDTLTGANLIFWGDIIIGCYCHSGGTSYWIDAGVVMFNRLESSGNVTTIRTNRSYSPVMYNTIALTGSGNSGTGILDASGDAIIGNSIWCNAGTGTGINLSGTAGEYTVLDNIIEGFSGTGGVGISGSNIAAICGNNFYRNNATNNGITGSIPYAPADTTLGSEPFNNPTGSPPDLSLSAAGITACKGKALFGQYYGNPFTSYRDAGAVQHQDAGGSGGGKIIGA